MEFQVLSGPPNPDDQAIRTGLLLAMEQNFRQIASRLRWGYARYGPDVMKSGYGPKAHALLVNARKKLEQEFMRVGGNPDQLRQTILNYRAAVAPTGLAGKGTAKSGSSGTGNAIIDAALSLLSQLFSMLGQARTNDPNDPIPDEYLPGAEPEAEGDVAGLGALRTQCYQAYVAPLRSPG